MLVELVPCLRGRRLKVSLLGGGLTNHNYRIDAGNESYVLRVAGKDTRLLGIDRECEFCCAHAAAESGVGPEVVAYLPEQDAMVRRFVPGRVLQAEDLRQPATLRRVVESVRRVHSGPPGAGIFSPFVTVRNYLALARERRATLPDDLKAALERFARIERDLQTGDALCLCHNDLLAGNFIDDGEALRIIDWEYAGRGDRFFDLANLAANNEFDDELERTLLELYFGGVRPDHLRRLRRMRLASDLREAVWGYLQAVISTLDVDYLAYGRKHLDRFLASA